MIPRKGQTFRRRADGFVFRVESASRDGYTVLQCVDAERVAATCTRAQLERDYAPVRNATASLRYVPFRRCIVASSDDLAPAVAQHDVFGRWFGPGAEHFHGREAAVFEDLRATAESPAATLALACRLLEQVTTTHPDVHARAVLRFTRTQLSSLQKRIGGER